jgi:predicted DNA-binding protein (MmcQ/YjbR family)
MSQLSNDVARAHLAASVRGQRLLNRLRAIALALPEAQEVEAWGLPTFRVRKRIFTNLSPADEGWICSLKCTPARAAALIAEDPRFRPSPHMGKHGWVYFSLTGRIRWSRVGALVADSYRLVAPKSLAATSTLV